MENNYNMVNNQRTNLAWDKYMDYLIKAIDESNFVKRSQRKPMTTPIGDTESHITSRAVHTRMAADIAGKIAKELGLNEGLAYIGMMMHDAGHSFGGHEGESMANTILSNYHCGFFHHNAKGVETIWSENIFEKAINSIPNIELQPELRAKLMEESAYFLDIVISHDGEATPQEMEREENVVKYNSMEEAVDGKLTLANAGDKYKFVAQTPEGRIAKFADVIAYMATDIRDGFRLGIIDSFDDDYLELFGEMFTNGYTNTREERIELAQKIINEEMDKQMRELSSDMQNEYDSRVLYYAKKIIARIEKAEEVPDIDIIEGTSGIQAEIFTQEIAKMKEERIRQEGEFSEEDEQIFLADIVKVREFITKKMAIGTRVVHSITNKMQGFFINDLLMNSRQGTLQFSAKGRDLFYKLKGLNYKKIVQHTKQEYQTHGQPEAVKGIVDNIAGALVQSGAIRNKFYDRAIREEIRAKDEDAYSRLKVKKKSEDTYKRKQKEMGVYSGYVKIAKKRYKFKPIHVEKAEVRIASRIHEKKIQQDVYLHLRKQGKNFVTKYLNVYNAIPTTVKKMVEEALNENYKNKSILGKWQRAEREKMRREMIVKYGSLRDVDKDEYIAMKIEEERNGMEKKMAIQEAVDYLMGMNDAAFNDLVIRLGYMTREQIDNSKRGAVCSPELTEIMSHYK